uniref:Ig-like domain-containing protein n=1 Tax=Rattus norvegicus TaxID=10116 RepID=A0ABK0L4J4_RAT
EVKPLETGGGLEQSGNSLKLSCATSGFTFSTAGMSWIHQAPGNVLERLAQVEDKSNNYFISYVEYLKGRFTISRDNSKESIYLQVNILKEKDTAIYYCIWHSEGASE